MANTDQQVPRRGDGVHKRGIIVFIVFIAALLGAMASQTYACSARYATGAPTLWSTVTTHRPVLPVDALDSLPNTTNWPAALHLACHGNSDLCNALQDASTYLLHDHATVRLLHDRPPTKASTCSEHAAQLSTLPPASQDSRPTDVVVLRVASSSLCSQPTAAHGTHATALVLPPATLDGTKVASIIKQLLHGHLTLMLRICASHAVGDATMQHVGHAVRHGMQRLAASLAPVAHAAVWVQVAYCSPHPPAPWSDTLGAWQSDVPALTAWLHNNWASSTADMPLPEAARSECSAGLDALHDHMLLRWLLYVPQRPLLLHDGADSVCVAGEGGLVLLPANATTAEESGHAGVTSVVQHLRRQLGAEGDGGGVAWAAGAADANAVLGALPTHQLLQRQRTGNFDAARQGLHALRDVVQALPTLSLPDIIGTHVHRAGQAAAEGMVPPLHKAAASMACARQLVDGALRHPAVMTRLSVPPEHHVAVYLPLLLPLLVPLARGLIAEGSRAVRRAWRR